MCVCFVTITKYFISKRNYKIRFAWNKTIIYDIVDHQHLTFILMNKNTLDLFLSSNSFFLDGRVDLKPDGKSRCDRCWVTALGIFSNYRWVSERFSLVWCALQFSKQHLSPWIQTLQLCRAKSWCWDIHWGIATWVIHSPIFATLL